MSGYRLGVDIGGTFTDFALFDEAGGSLCIHKCLTTPEDPSRAVIEGAVALLERESVDVANLREVVHGTTLVTNAVIERKGARTGMLITEGFRDIPDMREEKRYDVFDLRITFPEPIVARARRREVSERMRYDGTVERPLDLESARSAVQALVREEGIEALAICLLHAYANPAHEEALRRMTEASFPGLFVSTSAEVFPGWREFERFTTTGINAFTGPMFDRYLERIESGLSTLGFRGRLYVMSASGGALTPTHARRLPVRVIESGPAAGAQMSAVHGRALTLPNLLSFDMGGTTAKGALVREGAAMKVYSLEVARAHEFKAGSGLPVRTPVIDMIEIGAGGGSIAEPDTRGTIRVGPKSAGARPGPACYGQGGREATLSDANLVLGYLDPDYFLGGAMRLDPSRAETAITERIAKPLGLSLERAAFGIHDIVSEDVARAFRIHASERGFDYRSSSMVAFGGSGPVHAIRVARKLGIPRVVFPVAAGVMSAIGLLASPLAFEVALTRERFVRETDDAEFLATFAEVESEASAPLVDAGLNASRITLERRLDMHYHGQGHEIEVTLPHAGFGVSRLAGLFRERYEALYAFAPLDAPLVITTWKVEARAPDPGISAGYSIDRPSSDARPARTGERRAWFPDSDAWVSAAVYDRNALPTGCVVEGPAFVEERESTVVIGPGDRAEVDANGNLVAELDGARPADSPPRRGDARPGARRVARDAGASAREEAQGGRQ